MIELPAAGEQHGGGDRAVRLATAADHPRMARALAAAFQLDPGLSYAFLDAATRARRLPALFAIVVAGAAGHGPCWVAADGGAVALWTAPDTPRTTIAETIRGVWPVWRAAGSAIGRLAALDGANQAHRPKFAHWYLALAGCDPQLQGTGLGGALVRTGLGRADADGVPAYLETLNPANVGFYHTFGFEPLDEWTVGRRGPRAYSMIRPVR